MTPSPNTAGPRLPEALRLHPELDSWLRIDLAQTITVFTGKVEIGQGIRTTVAQIAAEELDVSMHRMRVVLADTELSPDEGYTAGSNSTKGSGGAIRQIAAEVRALLMALAAQRLHAPVERLMVYDGVIIDPVTENQTDYWELQGGKPFLRRAAGSVRPKAAADYRLVGTSAPRLDLPEKICGAPVYVDDMALPGMLHGRVVRPPWRGPYLTTPLGPVDTDTVLTMPGVVAVVRNGNFLAVAAQREEQALAAARHLEESTGWDSLSNPHRDSQFEPVDMQARHGLPLNELDAEFRALLQSPWEDRLIVEGAPVEGEIPPLSMGEQAVHTLDAVYTRPFQMHGALGPSAAMAQWQDERLTIWTHSQGVFPLRDSLAQLLNLPPTSIRVIHTDGPGCYGHNGADDVAVDAALLARGVPGRPVLLKWTRRDEHYWEPYGPAMVMQVRAGVDREGRMVGWNYDVWSYSHSGRPRPVPGASGLLAAPDLTNPLPYPPRRPGSGSHNGGYRNADPLYAFADRRIVKHFVAASPVRTSSLRSLGGYANVFAIESAMDELAHAAGIDPVAFRLAHLDDPRAKAVLEAAADHARRHTWTGPNRGRGVAFARYKNESCYAAVVVDVEVEPASGKIHVVRAVIGGDAGQIINPNGLANQLEGGVVQATSWTLKEAVRVDAQGNVLTPRDTGWEGYPVLRMEETPAIETVLLNRSGAPVLGAGEATQGPTAAAIANAVFDAVGVRLRHIPFTPQRVSAALAPHTHTP